jgi:hypothetical protein
VQDIATRTAGKPAEASAGLAYGRAHGRNAARKPCNRKRHDEHRQATVAQLLVRARPPLATGRKALSLNADAVILDIEDAVAVAEKPAAREAVAVSLGRPRRGWLYV